MNTETTNHAHPVGDPENVRRLLADVMNAAIAHGRTVEEVNEGRRIQRRKGTSDSQIASCEFAELRLFDDLDDTQTSEAALAGTPSAVTLALAERDGYCASCLRFWYGTFAQCLRENASELTT